MCIILSELRLLTQTVRGKSWEEGRLKQEGCPCIREGAEQTQLTRQSRGRGRKPGGGFGNGLGWGIEGVSENDCTFFLKNLLAGSEDERMNEMLVLIFVKRIFIYRQT